MHSDLKVSFILVTHDIGAITSSVGTIACLNKKLFFHGKPSEFEPNRIDITITLWGKRACFAA